MSRDHVTPGGESAVVPSSPFPTPTLEQWRALAREALRGRPLEELGHTTLEGLELEPLYTEGQDEGIPHLGGLPGQAPFVRGPAAPGRGRRSWLRRTDLALPLPEAWGTAASEELEQGSTALGMMLDDASRAGLDPDAEEACDLVGQRGLSLSSLQDLEQALESVDPATTALFVEGGGAGLQLAGMLLALARRRGIDAAALQGSLSCDPLGELAAGGALPVPLSQAYDEMAALMTWATEHSPRLRVAMVHLDPYHDAGASAVHELALSLATGAEYLAAMTDRGLTPDQAARRISFSFPTGPRLLTEMSKLRAARLLWSRVCDAFGCVEDASTMRIHARTSRHAMTARDPWTNILRGTLGAFAGVLASADCISVAPFDAALAPSNMFSRRLARNIQLILEHEVHLAWVSDPAGGSHTVEAMTDGLARQAWDLFQQMEKAGGMAVALEQGLPQRFIGRLARHRREAVASASQTVVGVNRFALPREELPRHRQGGRTGVRAARQEAVCKLRDARPDQAAEVALARLERLKESSAAEQVEAAMTAAEAGATLGEMTAALRRGAGRGPEVEPLNRRRTAEDFDLLREASDAATARDGVRPGLLLCGLGPLAHRRVRQELAADVARAGGLEPVELELDLEAPPEEAAREALEAEATTGAVLLCGDDEAYARAADLIKALKAARPRLCVGMVTDLPALEGEAPAGVDLLVHKGMDRVKIIGKLQRELGVTL